MVASVTPQDQGFGGSPPPPGGDPVARAAELVKVPAILLLVMAGLIALYALYALASGGSSAAEFDKALNDPKMTSDAREVLEKLRPWLLAASSRVWTLIPLVGAALIGFGGWQMRQVKSYGLAMTASFVAMLPLFPACCCCVFGLPVGIWSVVVLMKPEVKAAFQGR